MSILSRKTGNVRMRNFLPDAVFGGAKKIKIKKVESGKRTGLNFSLEGALQRRDQFHLE